MTFQNIILNIIFLSFIIFSPIVFFLTPRRLRPYTISLIGIIFYFLLAGGFLFLILGEIILVYLLTRKGKRNIFYTEIGILISLFSLAYYKVLIFQRAVNFIANTMVTQDYFLKDTLLLPLGLSFFTFLLIHYIIDYRKCKIKQHKFVDFFAFVMFFPTMAAGPLRRFQHFNKELYKSRFIPTNVFNGAIRILIGLFKKIVIADSLAVFAVNFQRYYTATNSSPAELWLSIFAFSLMIYFDFSALADIAIGSSKIFGIKVPENFNNPYLKRNIALFWRSWHITLYNWLLDYVYKPLGGSRTTKIKAIRNILIVFVLVGLWHGVSLGFVIWGLYHGLLVSAYKLYADNLRPVFQRFSFYSSNGRVIMATTFTFFLVSVGWVFFATTHIDTSILVMKKIFLVDI